MRSRNRWPVLFRPACAAPEEERMRQHERQQWNTTTIERTRKHLRKNLHNLPLISDREEIESEVMAEIAEAIAGVSDFALEQGRELPNFESDADSLALEYLQRRDWQERWFREP